MTMSAELKAEFRGHFDHLAAGELAFPRCEDCGRWHWYPMALCPHCRSSRVKWQTVRGDGRIWSWTVVRHPFDDDFRTRLPYVVALVCFEEAPGVRLVANVEGVAPDGLSIGMPVELVRPAAGGTFPRPLFRPAGSAGT
jgi:uncharacterized OB-fold protein